MCKAGLNDTAGARKSFGFALLLDPQFKLAGKPAPRVSTPFLEAKAWAKEHAPPDLTLSDKRDTGATWTLVFTVPPAETEFTNNVLFALTDGTGTREVELPIAQAGKLEVPADTSTRVTWKVRDTRGWTLSEGGPVALEPRVAPQPSLPPVATYLPRNVAQPQLGPTAPPPRRRVFTWISGGLSVLSAGAAVALGFFARDTQLSLISSMHDSSTANYLVERLRTESTLTNVSWIAAGAFLVAGVILFFVEGS